MRAMSDADTVMHMRKNRNRSGATRSNECCEQVMRNANFFLFWFFFFVGRVDSEGERVLK